MLSACQERGIRAFHDLDQDVIDLRAILLCDLHSGSAVAADLAEDLEVKYHGFAHGCRALREKIDFCGLFVDEDGFVTDSTVNEEYPDQWLMVDARAVRAIVLGKELASYV